MIKGPGQIDLSNANLSNTEDLSFMFSSTNFQSIDLSNLYITKVNNM